MKNVLHEEYNGMLKDMVAHREIISSYKLQAKQLQKHLEEQKYNAQIGYESQGQKLHRALAAVENLQTERDFIEFKLHKPRISIKKRSPSKVSIDLKSDDLQTPEHENKDSTKEVEINLLRSQLTQNQVESDDTKAELTRMKTELKLLRRKISEMQ